MDKYYITRGKENDMPQKSGTGPEGKGPRTGQGKGPCPPTKKGKS